MICDANSSKADFLALAPSTNNQWWRYVLVLALTLICSVLISNVKWFVASKLGYFTYGSDSFESYANTKQMDANLSFGLLFVSHIFFIFFFLLFYKLIHKAPIKNLFTAAPKFRYGRFFISAAIFFALMLAVEVINIASIGAQNIYMRFQPEQFCIGFLLALLLLPFQTLREEIIDRAYLSQGFASIVHRRWIVIILSSILFGFGHIYNAPVVEGGYWSILYYVSMGLTLALCTVLDDGLELAWGAHFANNLLASLFLRYNNADHITNTIFCTSYNFEISRLYLLSTIICLGLFLLILTKIYHWDWRRLLGRIEKPVVERAE